MSEEVKERVKQVAKERKDKKGVLRLRSQEVDGVKHGKTEVFDADGKLRDVCEYRNGRKHGESLQYDETGTLRRKAMYCKGILEHEAIYCGSADGSIYNRTVINRTPNNMYNVKRFFNNDRFVREYTVYSHQIRRFFEHNLKSTETCRISPDSYQVTEFKGMKKYGVCQVYVRNNLVYQVCYVDNLKQGIEFTISENFRLDMHYVNGIPVLSERYKDNTLTSRCELTDGKECGLQEHFHANGNIKKRSTRTPDGQEIDVQEFDESGNLIMD